MFNDLNVRSNKIEQHIIFLTPVNGREMFAFMWTRSPQAGIDRAMREAPKFGFTPKSARAAKLANDNFIKEPVRARFDVECDRWVVEIFSSVVHTWINQGEFLTQAAAEADLKNWR